MIKRGSIVAYNGKRFRSFTKVADIKGNQIIAGDSICSIDNGKWVPTRKAIWCYTGEDIYSVSLIDLPSFNTMMSTQSLHLPLTLDTPYPIEYDGKMHSKFIDQQLVKHGSIMFKIILSTMKQCAMDFTRASQEADEMCL